MTKNFFMWYLKTKMANIGASSVQDEGEVNMKAEIPFDWEGANSLFVFYAQLITSQMPLQVIYAL
jgi:hypothetical protein